MQFWWKFIAFWCLFAYLILLLQDFIHGQTDVNRPQAIFKFNNETKNLSNAPAFFPVYQAPTIPESAQEAGLAFLPDSILPPSNVTVQFQIPRSAPFLTLGGIFDLTNANTGDISPTGILYAEAFKCAIIDINNNISLLPNTTLTYQVMDSGMSAAQALNAATLLTKYNAVAIIGILDFFQL
jgi:Receptor family ligand binding region